jgi:hypothetical protein
LPPVVAAASTVGQFIHDFRPVERGSSSRGWDGQIARIRANEEAKAQLTAQRRDKLKGLLAERWKAMRERMQQGRPDAR